MDFKFLSQSGVKTLKQVVTTGDLNIGDASKALAPVLRSEIANSSRFAATHYPELGRLLVLIGSTVWIYQYTYKAWVRMVGADVLGMFGTTDGRLYLCGTGFLYQYDSGKTFAGVNIKWIWETAWLTLAKGLKAFLKLMEVITFPDTETTVNVQLSYDMNLSTMEHYMSFQSQPLNLQYIDAITDWDAVINFDEILYNIVRIPLFGAGKSGKIIFSNHMTLFIRNASNNAWIQIGHFDANGKLIIDTGYGVTSVTANYTATLNDEVILANATAGAVTVTLPTAVGNTGKKFVIKKIDSSANTVTVDPNGSETIDGQATAGILAQDNAIICQSDGANWRNISKLSTLPAIRDIARGLVVMNNITNPNYQVDIDINEIVLKDNSSLSFPYIATAVDLTLDVTVNGINGHQRTVKTGTASCSGTTVTGSGTLFTTEFAVGDVIWFNTAGVGRRITAIAGDTALTVESSLTASSQE